jgi:hypothetical protein
MSQNNYGHKPFYNGVFLRVFNTPAPKRSNSGINVTDLASLP